jgi:hypothetical protein
MKAPLRSIITKISLRQPTQAEYIELDKTLGAGYERTALVGLSLPTPTYESLGWGEYWMSQTTASADQVVQAMRQALAHHEGNIRALDVQVINDPNVPSDDLTWEQGWEKLRSAHAESD